MKCPDPEALRVVREYLAALGDVGAAEHDRALRELLRELDGRALDRLHALVGAAALDRLTADAPDLGALGELTAGPEPDPELVRRLAELDPKLRARLARLDADVLLRLLGDGAGRPAGG